MFKKIVNRASLRDKCVLASALFFYVARHFKSQINVLVVEEFLNSMGKKTKNVCAEPPEILY